MTVSDCSAYAIAVECNADTCLFLDKYSSRWVSLANNNLVLAREDSSPHVGYFCVEIVVSTECMMNVHVVDAVEAVVMDEWTSYGRQPSAVDGMCQSCTSRH